MPTCSMYGVFIYMRLTFMENVGKYAMDGAYGMCWEVFFVKRALGRTNLWTHASFCAM